MIRPEVLFVWLGCQVFHQFGCIQNQFVTFQGIVDIVVIAGLLIKKDIVETGHVMIGHELRNCKKHFDIVSNCFCFNVVIDDLVDVFGSSLKHNIGYTDICIISLFLRVTLILIAQQLEPKLYDGNVIEKTNAIVIPDSEETLMLAEESHFATRFVPQTELSAEQAFWSQNYVNSAEPTLSSRPTKVEVPKELAKVCMVNTSLKKLKHHLAGFDVVVKERTTATTIIEGSWGFKHTKACFRDEIIPFAVEQHRLESKTFEVKMNQVLNENKRLLEQVISKDIVNMIVNSYVNNASVNVLECVKCLNLETELLNKKDFVEKEIYDNLDNSVSNESAPSFDQLFELNELKAQSQEKDTVIKKVSKLIAENEHLKQTYKQLYDSIKPARIRSKEQCDDLINEVNLKSTEISDLNASLQEKVLVITALKDDLRKLKGKALVDNDVTKHPSDPEMLKIDMEPITLNC
ncbi:hypothetical protein Tco_0105334 [Tanacetum coccineum]